MRFSVALAVVGFCGALGGCFGPQGNPDGMPYATDPDGAMGAPPQVIGVVSYDPYGKPAPFADMTAGQAAISPSATPPLNLTTQGQSPAPKGPAPVPQPH